jgi:hypothetical protein
MPSVPHLTSAGPATATQLQHAYYHDTSAGAYRISPLVTFTCELPWRVSICAMRKQATAYSFDCMCLMVAGRAGGCSGVDGAPVCAGGGAPRRPHPQAEDEDDRHPGARQCLQQASRQGVSLFRCGLARSLPPVTLLQILRLASNSINHSSPLVQFEFLLHELYMCVTLAQLRWRQCADSTPI